MDIQSNNPIFEFIEQLVGKLRVAKSYNDNVCTGNIFFSKSFKIAFPDVIAGILLQGAINLGMFWQSRF